MARVDLAVTGELLGVEAAEELELPEEASEEEKEDLSAERDVFFSHVGRELSKACMVIPSRWRMPASERCSFGGEL